VAMMIGEDLSAMRAPAAAAGRAVLLALVLVLLSGLDEVHGRQLVGIALGAVVVAAVAVVVHCASKTWTWHRPGPVLRQSVRNLGLVMPSRRDGTTLTRPRLMWWFLVAPALVTVALFWWFVPWVGTWMPAPSGTEITANAQRQQLATGVPTAILVSFAVAGREELLFRAGVLAAARKWDLRLYGAGPVRAAIWVLLVTASTVAFGFFHLDYGARNVVAVLPLGLLCCLLTLSSRSLWPAIIAHGLYDSLAFINSLTPPGH